MFVLPLPPLPAPLPFPTLPVHPAVSEPRPPNDRKLRVFFVGEKGGDERGDKGYGGEIGISPHLSGRDNATSGDH